MKSLKSVIGAIITVGLFSLTTSASADVFNPRFPVTELHGVNGANSSSSLAACAVMGAQGFSNAPPPASWETFITSSCTAKTKLLAGPLSMWPATCNPTGMAQALNAFTPLANWVTFTYDGTAAGQTAALNNTVISLQTYGSPAVVPIYGQADHWITLIQVTATNLGPGSWSIQQVKGFDGGPVGGVDSGFSNYYAGLQSWGGTAWKSTFFLVVTAINPACDGLPGGCGGSPNFDPFYGKYVLMYEPPAGDHPHLDTVFDKSPGIVPAGHNAMNEHLAQMRVFDALSSAGIDKDPQIWDVISGGVAGPASLVNGRWPDGSAWNYYLVPILSGTNANTAIAYVQLSADDGSFDHINVPPTPVAFATVSKTRAAQLAGGALGRGERLTGGTLTWDPRSSTQLAKAPNLPYYEFGVDGTHNISTAVRVMLHDGSVLRAQ